MNNSRDRGTDKTRNGYSPKLADIAAVAGVSTATVSRCLAGIGRIGDDTRRRVLKAAEEVGYRANRHARSLRMQRSNVLMVVVPDIANQNYAKLLLHIDRAAFHAGYEIMLAHTGVETTRADRLADELFTGGIDGILLTSAYCPPRIRARLESGEKLPVVRTLYPTDSREGLLFAQIDEEAAAHDIVAHLVAEGARSVLHLAGPDGELVTELREAGWRRALVEAGLGPGEILHRGFHLEDGQAAAHSLLDLGHLPDAVFCAADLAAFGMIAELRQSGIQVPRDLLVASFDDVDFSSLFTPPLTTVHLPRREMAEASVRCLIDTIEGRAPTSSTVAHRLMLRESSRRASPVPRQSVATDFAESRR